MPVPGQPAPVLSDPRYPFYNNQEANARLYGEATSGREILVDSKVAVPASAQRLVDSIRGHMAAAVAQEKREDAVEQAEKK